MYTAPIEPHEPDKVNFTVRAAPNLVDKEQARQDIIISFVLGIIVGIGSFGAFMALI